MKKIFLIVFVSHIVFSTSLRAIEVDENSHTLNSIPTKFSLGAQVKFMSGIGFAGDFYVKEKIFLTGSVSWLFSIIDFSFGSGYKLNNSFDLMAKLNMIFVETASNRSELLFPEISGRLKLSKSFFIESGVIIPFTSENRDVLMQYLDVPFIVNVGIVINFLRN